MAKKELSAERIFEHFKLSRQRADAAQRLTGEHYPFNTEGINRAKMALDAQFARIQPAASPIDMANQIIAKDPLIQVLAGKTKHAILSGDTLSALEATNHLHAYARVDHEAQLGGFGVTYSNVAHKLLWAAIKPDVLTVDPFLSLNPGFIEENTQYLDQNNLRIAEEQFLHTIIHYPVINGIFGEEAMQYFDPKATGLI